MNIVDPGIMQELLDSPGVKENVAQMSPQVLAYFKELLVKQGVYARFVQEKKDAARKRHRGGKAKG